MPTADPHTHTHTHLYHLLFGKDGCACAGGWILLNHECCSQSGFRCLIRSQQSQVIKVIVMSRIIIWIQSKDRWMVRVGKKQRAGLHWHDFSLDDNLEKREGKANGRGRNDWTKCVLMKERKDYNVHSEWGNANVKLLYRKWHKNE